MHLCVSLGPEWKYIFIESDDETLEFSPIPLPNHRTNSLNYSLEGVQAYFRHSLQNMSQDL